MCIIKRATFVRHIDEASTFFSPKALKCAIDNKDKIYNDSLNYFLTNSLNDEVKF